MDIKYHPSAILSQLYDWFSKDTRCPYECAWRLEEALSYWKNDKKPDEHLVYCLEGLAWRFEHLAKKIRNMDKSEIRDANGKRKRLG